MPKRKKSRSQSRQSSQRQPRKKNRLWVLLITALLGVAGIRLIVPPTENVAGNANLLLGNPTGAVTNPANTTNYLIVRPQYVLSYNRDKGIANWASWQLNQSWLGTLPRPQFAPDTTLPASWYIVQPDDYTRSGFDRGHLVPAADRNRLEADSTAVFLMTNIVPQAPDNNRGPWERLESYSRDLVEQGKELYIIAGSAGLGGIGERGKRNSVGNGNVTVPAAMWKVIVVLDRPGSALADITPSTRVIAVVMPNQQGIKENNWQQFRTTVDNVEALTGYNFLTKVSEPTQDILEARIDNQ
jgi:endonuclease G, mitochondrial